MWANLHCPDGWEGGRLERGQNWHRPLGMDGILGYTSHSKSSVTMGRVRELHTACAREGSLSCCRLPWLREGVRCSQAH